MRVMRETYPWGVEGRELWGGPGRGERDTRKGNGLELEGRNEAQRIRQQIHAIRMISPDEKRNSSQE
jgi:hypothetical protein